MSDNIPNIDHDKTQPIEGFIPLSLKNSFAIWTFGGITTYSTYMLSLRVNAIGGNGFASIQINDHEALILARALTRILKSIMKKETVESQSKDSAEDGNAGNSGTTNISICQRPNTSLALSFKRGGKSVTLHFNGSTKFFIEISLEKAQLLRLKSIELLSLCYPMLSAQFLADELLVSINS